MAVHIKTQTLELSLPPSMIDSVMSAYAAGFLKFYSCKELRTSFVPCTSTWFKEKLLEKGARKDAEVWIFSYLGEDIFTGEINFYQQIFLLLEPEVC